jgi:hypothetical protein
LEEYTFKSYLVHSCLSSTDVVNGREKSYVCGFQVVAYDQYGAGQPQQELPRPPLIQWEKDLANAVQLIGNVGRDIELKYLDSGKVVATTSLAVSKGRDKETSWYVLAR